MRRDPVDLFPGAAGCLFDTLGAMAVLWGPGRVSRRWSQLARNVVGGRSHAGAGPEAAALLVASDECEDGVSEVACALSVLARGLPWAPEACLVFVTEHCRAMAPSRGGRSLEADVAARLPKECLVVVASTDGVLGPTPSGELAELWDAEGCACLLLRAGLGCRPPALCVVPDRPRKPARPDALHATQSLVAGGLRDAPHRFRDAAADAAATAAAGSGVRVAQAVREAYGTPKFRGAAHLKAAFVERWFDATRAAPEDLHVVLCGDTSTARAVVASPSGRGAHGPLVGGCVAGSDELLGGTARDLRPAAVVALSLRGAGDARASAAATVNDGAGKVAYTDLCRAALRRGGVAAPGGRGVRPALAVVATCVARGPQFHGGERDVEARAHAELLGAVPLVGFLANGELGPRNAPATWREEDDESDAEGAPTDYALHAYTTCLGFLGARAR